MRLDLLPASGLDLSVLVAVLGGTLLLFHLSEAFGWSFGGLVVPGYLASILVVSPAAGATIVAEAILTLACVLLVSDVLARTGLWSRFFGRERFLLFVLVSVLVRQAAEIWLLPALLARQDSWFGFQWLQPGEAHSVGLVLVPLTANALGRGSIGNGLRQLVVPTALAWGLLHFVLLAGTNLSLSAMSLTYEDVSLDFLQSARAYFVLAAGAVVATIFNGAFAWSAGGILIPALLGLAWYEPARIAATFLEAVLLAMTFRVVTRLPIVRDWNLEGARKLAVLFVFSVAFRIGVAWVHELGVPIRTQELSGLGYLLSALIALKILQFGSVPTVVLPALFTSAVAFLGGSTAAWALEQVLPAEQGERELIAEVSTTRLLTSPEGVVEYARIRTRLDPERAPSIHLPASRLSAWRDLWRTVDAGLGDPEQEILAPAGGWLAAGRGADEFGGRRWWIVREPAEGVDDVEGWGVGVVRPGAPGPVLVVERAWSDPTAARTSVARCIAVDCAVLYLAGMELPTGTDDARDALLAVVSRPVEHASATTMERAVAPPPATRSLGEAVTAALERPARPWSASPTELAFVTNTLVPAVASWAAGGTDADEVEKLGGLLGFSVEAVRGCGDSDCLVLDAGDGGPWLAVRRGGAPVLITASHPRNEVGTLRLALGAFDSLQARALVVDPAPPTAPVPPALDPMQALHLGWRRALAGEGGTRSSRAPLALWFRGLGAGLPGTPRPTEDVVIGAGRPVFGGPPAGLATLVDGGKLAAIWTQRWAAANEDEPGLAGNHLPGPQADLELGGVTPGVLWFSEATRQRWRSDDRASVAEWVGAAGLTLTDAAGSAPVEALEAGATMGAGRSAKAATDLRFEQLADLARRAAHQHNLNLLRRLADAADRHTVVRAAWDPVRLLGRIEVEQREGARVWQARAWLVPGDDRHRTLASSASVAEIREALGWMPADLTFQPDSP